MGLRSESLGSLGGIPSTPLFPLRAGPVAQFLTTRKGEGVLGDPHAPQLAAQVRCMYIPQKCGLDLERDNILLCNHQCCATIVAQVTVVRYIWWCACGIA